jgi:HPt (histidine-containing phosphotransfer) domain-containing protein
MPLSAFNLNYLDKIFDGNRKSVIEVIALFVEELPGAKENLKIAIEKKDAVATRKAAHKIKSSLRALGAEKLADIAANIETSSEKNFYEVSDLSKKFHELLPELERQLHEFLTEEK